MIVLSMAWSIYDHRLKEFMGNFTGGGLAIKNICEYIGRKADSYLFIGKCHLPEQKLGNITIVGTDFKLNEDDNDLVRDENYLKNMATKFEMAIERIKPDIVNFHGSGSLMQYCIQVCIKKNIPYVYTEHLYIGLNSKVENYEKKVAWENILYRIPGLPIIAVSQGMKRRILQDFADIPETRIHVIANGTDFIPQKVESDYIEKYHVQDKKVLLCVGTILQRKNQMQIIDAYLKMPLETRDNVKVIFCGKDSMQGEFQEKIKQTGLERDLIYAGALSSEEMKKMYSIADGLIMPSLAEGLSIAALEAISYGLPVIMFSDLEGADELNDDKVTCFVEDRLDHSLAAAITNWYHTVWDREYIRNYSQKFTLERVAADYIAYYQSRMNG